MQIKYDNDDDDADTIGYLSKGGNALWLKK